MDEFPFLARDLPKEHYHNNYKITGWLNHEYPFFLLHNCIFLYIIYPISLNDKMVPDNYILVSACYIHLKISNLEILLHHSYIQNVRLRNFLLPESCFCAHDRWFLYQEAKHQY